MEESTNTFTYSNALDVDQIRVIIIDPGKGEQAIHSSLVTVRRSSDEPYKVLSYAWGETTGTHRIFVNEKEYLITKSLFEALCQVRNSDHVVRLWADAICINQADVSERNAQVQQMGMTFSKAEEVLIWLGSASSDVAPLQFICDFSVHGFADEQITWDNFLKSSKLVFGRPWFQRLWVFQEAMLARRGIIMLGNDRCDLDAFLIIKDIQFLRTFDWEAPTDTGAYESGRHASGYYNACTIGHSRKYDLDMDGRLSLHGTFIKACRTLQCLDARDHVFGLTGLAELLGAECDVVDYRLTTPEVFIRTFKSMLIREPMELIFCETGDTGSLSAYLPSWVPDLSQQSVAPDLDNEWSQAGGTDRKFELSETSFSGDGRRLVITGFSVDTILEFCEPRGGYAVHEGDWSTWGSPEWQEMEEWVLQSRIGCSPYGGYAGKLQAYWRTLIANSWDDPDLDGRRVEWPQNDSGAAYEVVIGRATPIEKQQQNDDVVRYYQGYSPHDKPCEREFSSSVHDIHSGRSVFVTVNSYFGLGPNRAEPGDQIVIVRGLQTPLLLRERQSKETYQMVGPAYVHGMMKGELIETLRDAGELDSPQEFVID